MPVATTDPIFTIRLTGEGVQLHLIPASDLAELLIAAEQTVLALASRDHPEAADELIVALTKVTDTSIGFVFTSNRPDIALATYTELTTAVENRLFRTLPGRSLEGLRTLTRFSKEHRGHTQFLNGGAARPLLDLPPDYAVDIPAPDYQRGETILYGKVERVGGVRPRVRLRVSQREVIYGDISEEQSRVLGARLYSPIALRGQATWDANDGSIVYFRVEEILDYERGSIKAAFSELNEASAHAFDLVDDVDLFASRIREGEEP